MLMTRKTRNPGRLDINGHHFFGLGLRGFEGYESPRRLAMGKAEQRVPNSESVCCRLVASKGVPVSELALGDAQRWGVPNSEPICC
jgi:hypothetical protein